MMRNLIICCDGTWNTPDQEQGGIPTPTNVVRLYNALDVTDNEGHEQLAYYHPGVGTDGNWWEKLAGGGVGIGLDKNIMSAYRWLGEHYQADDHLFLFGFSRGAYTVRSFAGMLGKCGLLNLAGLSDNEVWKRVDRAFTKGYRKARTDWANDDWAFHQTLSGNDLLPIYFVGVWDTVGALGVPNDMTLLNILDHHNAYAFHDTTLGQTIEHARHAIAIDEMRESFTPTLWTGVDPRRDVKQIWFPGCHCDVGGGYPEIGLSDGALQWMMDEARDRGLAFKPGLSVQVHPNFMDVLHDSRKGLFKYLRSQPRSIPLLSGNDAHTKIHKSVLERQDNPPIAQAPYHPMHILEAGESRKVTVYAVEPWNETGLYLESGSRYLFAAEGQWLDRNIKCGPAGMSDGKFQAGEVIHLAGSLWGKVEGAFKKLTGNETADFSGTRRQEKLPWFSLVGAIANGGNPDIDGTPAPHETIAIGGGCEHTPIQSGYLYGFANDAWHFYGNNHGSVALTVTRIT